ncbi:MAG: hypothetical protein ACPG6P_09025, partial [Akkermansiaceae bacterium]
MQLSAQRTLLPCILMLWVLVACFCLAERPQKLPDSYRFIGEYKLNSHMRVESGVTRPVSISPVRYRVYSDGMEARVYCMTSDGGKSFTPYKIYRSDGIGVPKSSGALELVAGVQG